LLPSLGLGLLSVLVTLLLVEAAFRLVGVHVGTVQINRRTIRRSTNPRLRFDLRPGATAQAEVSYRINRQGMRNREVETEKPAGTRRIAILGDSIAFGYWVAEDDAFPRQLEKMLTSTAEHAAVEVLNFGVPGYNVAQETEILRERALDFDPDLVIVALCLNDLEWESYEHGLVMDRGTRSEHLTGWIYERLLDHSLLASWVEYRLAERAARREFVRTRDPWVGPLYAETLAQQQDALTARFRDLASVLEIGGKKRPGLVAVFPTFGGRFENYRHADFHRLAAKGAADAGLDLVDLLDCFRGYDYHDVRVDVVHPSPLGHRVAAHALADALCHRGWPCHITGRKCGDYRKEEFTTVRGF
jgi:lysophospholipase L1-like esterase